MLKEDQAVCLRPFLVVLEGAICIQIDAIVPAWLGEANGWLQDQALLVVAIVAAVGKRWKGRERGRFVPFWAATRPLLHGQGAC